MLPGHDADQIFRLRAFCQSYFRQPRITKSPWRSLFFLFYSPFQVPPEKEAFPFLCLLYVSPLCLSCQALQPDISHTGRLKCTKFGERRKKTFVTAHSSALCPFPPLLKRFPPLGHGGHSTSHFHVKFQNLPMLSSPVGKCVDSARNARLTKQALPAAVRPQ